MPRLSKADAQTLIDALQQLLLQAEVRPDRRVLERILSRLSQRTGQAHNPQNQRLRAS